MFKDNIFIEESKELINSSNLKKEEETKDIFKINEIEVDAKLSKTINRNKGKYITILWDKDNLSNNVESLIDITIEKLKKLLEELKITKKSKVLFVGLGNKEVTSDKFGYLVIEKIGVQNKTYKIYKDVEGLTNINSIKFTKMLSDMLEVDLIVVFDSLKAEHIERLGKTIQISTGGLYPGSTKNETKMELSKKTIKKEVLCIGIPTIINMNKIEKNNPNLLVSTKDIDLVVDDLSSIISIIINRLF